jgi:hypothetical protein
MADFLTCYNWMMQFEDPERKYAPVPDACPGGSIGSCYAISGINSGSFPSQFKAIAAAPIVDRPALVQAFYAKEFWDSWLEEIPNEVALQVFDFSVTSGSRQAIEILQEAVNALSAIHIYVDGLWGPVTVAAVKVQPAGSLVEVYKRLRLDYYQRLVNWNKYGRGWRARVLAQEKHD